MRMLAFASIAVIAFASANTAMAQPAASPAVPASAATSASSASDDADNRIRCRRIPITGSLVRVERVCKTVGEWRRLADRGNDIVRDQADQGRSCVGGGCSGN